MLFFIYFPPIRKKILINKQHGNNFFMHKKYAIAFAVILVAILAAFVIQNRTTSQQIQDLEGVD